jgi:uncharacterized phiE125 gp8 family phage protein
MIIQLTQPNIEPITLNLLKSHLRIDFTNEDIILTHYVKSARQMVENYTNLILMQRNFEYTTNIIDKDGYITLPISPVQTVLQLQIKDSSNNYITLDPENYTLSNNKIIPFNMLILSNLPDAIKVTFTAGFGNTEESIPPQLSHAVLLVASLFYEHRLLDNQQLQDTNLKNDIYFLLQNYINIKL